MARKSNEHRKAPPTQHSSFSCANTSISSINESPESKIPSDIRLRNTECTNNSDVDVTAVADGDNSSDSNSDEESINAFRDSVFDYPEWVTLVDLNDAGGDENCDNSTKASTKKRPKGGWKCNFCNQIFVGRNATKAICHLAGVRKMNISKCRGNIPEKHMRIIRERNEMRLSKIDSASKVVTARKQNMFRQQQSIVAGLEMMADQSTKGRSHAISSSYGGRTVTDFAAKALDVAISDLIYSKGLPFNLTESYHLKRVLDLAKSVSTKYKPPTRKRVSTDLLSAHYKSRIDDYKVSLQKEARRFGISFYGDGATVSKMSLINIMASGVHERSAVLDIVDTTQHLSEGGVKDAEYIANLFVEHINEIDPQHMYVDSVFFDGAASVQKAGKILAVKFPSITVLHGEEHIVLLFFSDIAKRIPAITQMISIYKKMYSVFGSGSYHSPHAFFRKTSQTHFGTYVGLIRAADTRMAGYFMAFARFIRLKSVLRQTVNSIEYIESKKIRKNEKEARMGFVYDRE